MNNNCPSPGCGAVYNLTSAHVGRSFTCKKCNAQLVVTAAGLELSGPPSFSPMDAGSDYVADDQPAPSRGGRSRGRGGDPIGQVINWLKTEVFTLVMGAGLFLMILFLFMPLIDDAKVERQKSRISTQTNKMLKEKDKDKQKKWVEDDRPKMYDEYLDLQDSATRWNYWYNWGMMWGFFLAAAGGLGYLSPQQGITRRVVGAVVVAGQVVVIVIAFVIASMATRGSSKPEPAPGPGPIGFPQVEFHQMPNDPRDL